MIELIANSEKMREIVRAAKRVAATDATVLITGESGTGKNALAEFVHAHSARAKQNLVKIDCASLPKELLEAELFGVERGAFTGADEARVGRLEAAHDSTLLLDEAALLPVAAQAKLLRVLEEREFERLGGRKTFKIDTRVIATTNVDLESAIANQEFRADLYFRLNVVRFDLPPLRERRADIAIIAEQLLGALAVKYAGKNLGLSGDAVQMLENYDFPGNIRELANLLERAVLIAQNDAIESADFPLELRQAKSNGADQWLTLAELEAQHIRATLRFVNRNKSAAAKLLGISRKSLYEKLARYKIVSDV